MAATSIEVRSGIRRLAGRLAVGVGAGPHRRRNQLRRRIAVGCDLLNFFARRVPVAGGLDAFTDQRYYRRGRWSMIKNDYRSRRWLTPNLWPNVLVGSGINTDSGPVPGRYLGWRCWKSSARVSSAAHADPPASVSSSSRRNWWLRKFRRSRLGPLPLGWRATPVAVTNLAGQRVDPLHRVLRPGTARACQILEILGSMEPRGTEMYADRDLPGLGASRHA